MRVFVTGVAGFIGYHFAKRLLDEGIEVFSQVETLDGRILDENALPPGETLRMRVTLNTLSRRSFLKVLGGLTAALTTLPATLAGQGSAPC